jgi:signal transduction histidine kinase
MEETLPTPAVEKEPPRVLLIDDDASLSRTLSLILRKAGYDVATASDSAEALRLSTADKLAPPYDVALIDVRLPGMSGLNLLAELKKSNPDITAVMMTGDADTTSAIAALNEGAYAYVLKPYRIEEVKAILARAVERTRLLRSNRALLESLRRANLELEARVRERTAALERASKNLATMNEKLEVANFAKTKFVSMVSHELRTPLASINGYAEQVLGNVSSMDEAEVIQSVSAILRNGQRLGRLIEGLLNLARIEEGRLTIALATFDLRELTQSVIDGLKVANPKNLHFHASVEESARMIFSERDRIEQIMLNLLANAVKFTPEGGEVGISVTLKDGETWIRVYDTGPGISEENCAKIFDPFFRTEDAIRSKVPGTGLGLTITRALVDTLGGRIWVESQLGRGSSFFAALPDINLASAV